MDILTQINELFPSFKKAEWESLLAKELKLADIEDAHRFDRNGIRLAPFYTAEDTADTASLLSPREWSITQYIAIVDGELQTNQRMLQALNQGAESLHIAINNVSIDLEVLFQDIIIDAIHIFIDYQGNDVDDFYQKIQDHFTALSQGEWHKFITIFAKNRPYYIHNLHTELSKVSIDGSIYNNAGASSVTELAAILFQLHQLPTHVYIDQKIRLYTKLAVDTQYFEQIAKLRALRHLVACWSSEYSVQVALQIVAESSRIFHTQRDPENNLIRNTIAALSSVLGGADFVMMIPYYTSDLDIDNKNRWVRNQLLLIKEEAKLQEVGDMAHHSYYIEHYAQEIARQAWSLYSEWVSDMQWQEILHTTPIGAKVSDDAQRLISRYQSLDATLIGVNKYAASDSIHSIDTPYVECFGIRSINLEHEISGSFTHNMLK